MEYLINDGVCVKPEDIEIRYGYLYYIGSETKKFVDENNVHRILFPNTKIWSLECLE